ncbi:MAG TPA: DUF192 domain-containing protein [Rhizomicrobium sp.]|jgi:uncharacterized membrane protein (UPF0127 family)|nr:DUF192 domain-containing protein [Rhizomicrobium sp.]
MHVRCFTLICILAWVLSLNGATALPVTTISVDTARGPHAFKVEVAADRASQQKGLMYRKKMGPDAGMIFDFHQDVMTSFWMKNTFLPLDIIFIRSDGTISSIAADAVPLSETPIPCSEPVRAVLELNAGRAATLGIVPGAKVRAPILGTSR